MKLFYDKDINEDLINLISYEKFKAFNSVLEVALNDKILEINEIDCYRYLINKELLLNSYTHNTIRLKNILRVILNEILIQYGVLNFVKSLFLYNEE